MTTKQNHRIDQKNNMAKYFTLIELLVVIAIIAILAAMFALSAKFLLCEKI